ncbi:ribose-5-phosphate isomerase [Saxibacter everestensis]|uniref:Ribose-5-phosphate isomerase B n=1 Tax=Saxibacter everestensis TaxID=2909229 RepID=A0ABY8QPQ8_9MICO|nr:ribose-5-phosphate isomerase [Brevibacteriaceae bacterium ZFBP1038]
MRVHLGTDHAGFEFKEALAKHLSEIGHDVVDHGATDYDAQDDYPAFCIAAGLGVVSDREAGVNALGVVIGGSGNGEQIAANKVSGVRAALAWNIDTAKLGRQHNDANVVAVGSRQHSEAEALSIVDAFLAEEFSAEPRHQRRIDVISKYESDRVAP